ncbi:MAG: hypothetical protein K2W95_14370 [Candidatus Obscuribacterales bacterium]|nr:hypothetical protein [Candidatus Obscuribacterales bacterium]
MNDKKHDSVKAIAAVGGLLVLCFVLIIVMLFGTATLQYLKQSEEMKTQVGTPPVK